MASAFQSNAFQNNAFQIEGVVCVPAFQANAFQNDAFQVCVTPAELPTPTPEVGGVGGLARGGRRKPVGPYAPAFPRRGTVRNIYLPDEAPEPELEQAEARPTEARPQTAKPTLAPLDQTVLPVVMDLAGGPVMMGLVDTIAAQAAFDFRAAQEADDEAALIAILAAIS